jgi:hypothetical protein
MTNDCGWYIERESRCSMIVLAVELGQAGELLSQIHSNLDNHFNPSKVEK